MAITWGSYDGHLRFGLDLNTSTPSTSSTTVTVTCKLYIQVDSTWEFDDDQTWTLSGNGGTSGTFHNSLDDNASQLLKTVTVSAAVDYDGTGTMTYSATLSGAYNGASPTHSRTITLPLRPASAPSTPGAPTVSSITATTATASWSAPAANGASLSGVAGQVSTSSAFGTTVTTWSGSWATSKALTGLPKGTTLYVRVQAKNAEGSSSWSAGKAFTTLTTLASAPSTPAVSSIGAQSATIAWSAPSDDGGTAITAYEVQRATDSSFTANAVTTSKTVSPLTLAGLTPGTTYYVRVRAITPAGSGAWSPTATFKTISALFIGNGTSWVPGLVYVGNGTSWVTANVRVGNGTDWK